MASSATSSACQSSTTYVLNALGHSFALWQQPPQFVALAIEAGLALRLALAHGSVREPRRAPLLRALAAGGLRLALPEVPRGIPLAFASFAAPLLPAYQHALLREMLSARTRRRCLPSTLTESRAGSG